MNAPSVDLSPARTTVAATARVAAVQHLLGASRHQQAWDTVLATVFDVLERARRHLANWPKRFGRNGRQQRH